MIDDLKILREFLEIPLNSSDRVFERFIDLPGTVCRGQRPERFLYAAGQRKNRVLLVAHADTIWDQNGKKPMDSEFSQHQAVFNQAENVFRSSLDQYGYGLGADDRAGCAMLWLLKDLGHSILITDGEEFGRKGSRWLMNSNGQNADIADELNRHHQFMVQLDRRNGSDFKCYQVGSKQFKAYLKAKLTGYSDAGTGSYTDITVLCREITGVNLSIGYHDEHGPEESLDVKEWEDTLCEVRNWLSEDDLPRFLRTHNEET